MASSACTSAVSATYRTYSLSPLSPLPHFFSLPSKSPFRALKLSSSVVASAVAAPNSSVLSEKAFEGLFDDVEAFGDSGGGGGADELDLKELELPRKLVEALGARGITHLFPIQRAVLVPAMEGRDIIARAKTGTGKTLAFGIPILKHLSEDDQEESLGRRGRLPRVLVLAPTRELANQVDKEMKESAPYLNTVCVYGGVSYNAQQNALFRGVDVVVGTPGRIIDLIKSGSLKLGEVEFLVLDEADQMLAVGFEEDVEVILQKLPAQRQSMLFSATMPVWIKKLTRKYLNNPLTIDLVGDQEEKLAEGIKLYAIPTTSTSKRTILSDLVTVYAKGGKAIVFTQTKRDADEVSVALTNSISSEALHGDISQHQRERTLNGFRQGKFSVLVATDVAARGLDIPNVDLIIHYELPNDSETFVHRSGRTGRAGKQGTAILMFTNSQRRTVRTIERDVGCKFEYISVPSVDKVLDTSAEQVVTTLSKVHPHCVEFFTPTAQKLIDEMGASALAAAIAQLSGFAQPPSSKSLLTHEQGWVTLQLTRESGSSRGFFSARNVTGFLSDVYSTAADEVGKIQIIADEKVQGAVFDLPEDIAKDLLNREIPSGNTISRITELPALQDDGPPSDFYGKSFNRDRNSRGGSRGGGSRGGSSERRGFKNSHSGWGRGSDDDDDFLSDTRRPSRPSTFGSGKRNFGAIPKRRSAGGVCFNCGQSGHKSADCPNKRRF